MFDNLTLGKFIDELRMGDPDALVRYDFCGLKPTTFASYRGFYEQLALGWGEDGEATVKNVLAEAEAALGHTFSGYKGGSYIMGHTTPLWVSNWGYSSGTAIVGVEDNGWAVMIKTAHVET